MNGDAAAINAPLCRCCEELLCHDGFTDPHVGDVCLECFNGLVIAEYVLETKVDGFSHCEAVGPDSGKGVLQ